MKIFKISIVALLFAVAFAFTSCGGNHSHDNDGEQGKEYTSAYICPMHCDGSGSDEMGACPVCGMDYVAKDGDAANSDDHNEHDHGDHDHDGHDH